MPNTSLLQSPSRIEIPYIKVTIGNYTFGVYKKTNSINFDNGFYLEAKITYPNYIKRLTIKKINGEVNEYDLNLVYPIQPGDDPNFFEKVFSSVADSRKIVFSYGDMSLPSYIYKNEEALITNITTNVPGGNSSVLSYSIKAVSCCSLTLATHDTFAGGYLKPSDRIKELLNNPNYGLKELFYGMTNDTAVANLGLIPTNDSYQKIDTKTNISILDYLKYLVSCMIPEGATATELQNNFYILSICDEISGETTSDYKNKISETLGGPYFKITQVSKYVDHSDAYVIDVGYPSQNIVIDLSINDNQNYSIYYKWQSKLNDSKYSTRIDNKGNLIQEYCPVISSSNSLHKTTASDKIWWSKVTQYPISLTITLKGLLRPATLMQYVRLNVYFYGQKYLISGLYIITKQVDDISESGYKTSLSLTRIDS